MTTRGLVAEKEEPWNIRSSGTRWPPMPARIPIHGGGPSLCLAVPALGLLSPTEFYLPPTMNSMGTVGRNYDNDVS